ncbi:hypothetical protein G647_10210 [Cladophialophora carrionii CBS 160.54]|uniref:Uncharacterized protein n=1 Tax=Cladophialophora carrionii CBS 160.54 TaxID=1279043 RepID=V9DIS2_9EURO|nr:uncharacterized protein G647_10210 [Cladophialophora carrionii CBS 160.54]ETI26765.1 hypothetical protein G647_10210 [Cladophialophora carrionii CBS 160.54]
MFSSTYSNANTSDDDDFVDGDSACSSEDAWLGAAALGESSQRKKVTDSSRGLNAYLRMRDSVKLHNRKTSKVNDPLPAKGATRKKSHTRRGRTWPGKTRTLKSVTSNKIHAAVFPNMRVPVYMRKRQTKKGHSGYAAVISKARHEVVPIMHVQCPMPGGTSVTTQTDPVEKITWGPISRIEATGHAKHLVKELRKAVKAAKKGKARAKDNKDGESDTDGEETSKPAKSPEKNGSTGEVKQGDKPAIEGELREDGLTPETASIAGTDITNNSMAFPARRGFRAPPATPGEDVVSGSSSTAAALSMPTLPIMHHIADTKLVEHFRLQHAKDPEAFEEETWAIKQGLIDAKVNRGGIPTLLREEYTVELASREGAEIAEKWAKGQAKSWEHPSLRSRGNSLKSQPSSGSLKARGGGGDVEGTGLNPGAAKKENRDWRFVVINRAPDPSPASSLPETEHDMAGPTSGLPVLEHEKPTDKPSTEQGESSTVKDDSKPKATMKAIKKALSRLNVADNISKITTYGTVRHQSFVKREVSDHGEKRTVKTWIEVTEVYEVPNPQKLTVKDIAAAVEQEDRDMHKSKGESERDDSDDDESESDDDLGEKEIASLKQTKKGKAKSSSDESSGHSSDASSSSDSSESESGSDSASDHDSGHGAGDHVYHDPNETGAASVFRSLQCLGEDLDAGNLSRISNDFGALIAGLQGEGSFNVTVDGAGLTAW